MVGGCKMNSNLKNPFSIVKASDFTDQQIADNWVDMPQGNGFLDVVAPLSTMPMILIGGKGSGKTHLMRYFSYPLQKIRYGNNVREGIKKDKFVGMYLKCGGFNSERFSGKGVSDEAWAGVFSYYFEIWIAQVVLETAIDIFKTDPGENSNEGSLCEGLLRCFDKAPEGECSTFLSVLNMLKCQQKAIDLAVNNCVFSGELEIEILASPGSLFFGFPEVFEENTQIFDGILFVYLVDELENFLKGQQVYIQTLIRDRRFPCSIKVGVRTYGVKTLKTFADTEENRPGSEFEYVRLDQKLREKNKEDYKNFSIQLCVKRLQESGIISDEVEMSTSDFYDFFESDANVNELTDLTGISSGLTGKTIKKLARTLQKHSKKIISADLATMKEIEEIPLLLTIPGKPLLERFAVYAFYKHWYRKTGLLNAAKKVKLICDNYTVDQSSEPEFQELISKFKLDLTAQLRKDNSKKQFYVGVDTLIDLSRGFPRSLLTLLKHIYQYSTFNGEYPFTKGRISVSSQFEGVRQSSMWYFDDARIAGKDGAKLKVAVERLAEIFRINRYSDKPSECSLRAFYANLSDVSEETKRLIDLASKWSLLIHDGDGRRDKNSERVDDKFMLNPMLVPHWGLPVGVRGVIRFSPMTLNSIFDTEYNNRFQGIKLEFEKARTPPFLMKSDDDGATQVPLGLTL
jgi:hypothetical protein